MKTFLEMVSVESFDVVMLQEEILIGQRIEKLRIDCRAVAEWRMLASIVARRRRESV